MATLPKALFSYHEEPDVATDAPDCYLIPPIF